MWSDLKYDTIKWRYVQELYDYNTKEVYNMACYGEFIIWFLKQGFNEHGQQKQRKR